MVRTETPVCEFNLPARDFSLTGVDGRQRTLGDCRGQRGTLIMFICNHCPYVRSVITRIVADCTQLASEGVSCVAINSNDPSSHPEDSFDNMVLFAEKHALTFPYLFDADQQIARNYGAVCTPDFFGYNADLRLQYRGRLDASLKQAVPGARRDLLLAMIQIARTGEGPVDQIPSMGCSIKWRTL